MPFISRPAGAALLALVSSTAQADFSLAPATVIGPQWQVDAVAVGDVNGDGRDDIVAKVLNGQCTLQGCAMVWLQQDDGTLAAPLTFFAGPPFESGLALGQLDRDAAQEIVLGSETEVIIIDWDTVRGTPVVRGTRAGALTQFGHMQDIALVDIDRDGALDIVGHRANTGATLYFGDGQGGIRNSLVLPTFATGRNDMEVGDFNGDGYDDLALISGVANDIRLHHNDGTPTFAAPRPLGPPPAPSLAADVLATGDFNGDGRDDVASLQSESMLRVFLQTAEGRLGSGPYVMSGGRPGAMLGHDIDGNGLDDVLMLDAYGISIRVALALPGGAFRPVLSSGRAPRSFAVNSQAIAAGDIDGDGCDDVVSGTSDGVVVHRGLGCRLPADLAADVGFLPSLALFHVANIGTGDAESVAIEGSIVVDGGTLSGIAPPQAGCTVVESTPRRYAFSCTLKAIPVGGEAVVPVSHTFTATARRARVTATMGTSTPSRERVLGNNVSQASRAVAPPQGR